MLQQTQVATVLPYFKRFVDQFPTVESLAAAPLDRVLEQWSGLGYYRRAHHLHAAAQVVMRDHGGRFPRDAATLATLPGIGRSTAAAIAAFAGDERGAILDGNVKRVLARHRGVDGWPGEPRVQAALWRVAEALRAGQCRRHPGVHAGDDGPRRDDLHAHAAALRCLPGCTTIASRGSPDESPNCRRRVRARRFRSAK